MPEKCLCIGGDVAVALAPTISDTDGAEMRDGRALVRLPLPLVLDCIRTDPSAMATLTPPACGVEAAGRAALPLSGKRDEPCIVLARIQIFGGVSPAACGVSSKPTSSVQPMWGPEITEPRIGVPF
jgi:hypothetical protein